VVAGPDEDVSGLIQLLGHFMRVEIVHGERDHADTISGSFRGIDMDTFNLP
jgi:hypothetical protein